MFKKINVDLFLKIWLKYEDEQDFQYLFYDLYTKSIKSKSAPDILAHVNICLQAHVINIYLDFFQTEINTKIVHFMTELIFPVTPFWLCNLAYGNLFNFWTQFKTFLMNTQFTFFLLHF